MGLMSRNKGKKGEREIATILREHGIEARRAAQYHGATGEAPDVIADMGWHIEVKRTESVSIYGWLKKLFDEALKSSKKPLLLHRKSRGEWIAVLRFEDFLKLVVPHGKR